MGRNPLIVAIEGTDGVGKTTIAQRFAEQFNATYVHSGPPTEMTWLDAYVKPISESHTKHMVLDRWHLGEIVWPFIWGRKSLFDGVNDFEQCCHELRKLNVMLAVVIRDPAGIERTLVERGEGELVEETIKGQMMYELLARSASEYMMTSVFNSDELIASPSLDALSFAPNYSKWNPWK